MRKGISGYLVVLCCGALLMAGGCAHKEQVKSSEPVAATQPTAAPTPAEQQAAQDAQKAPEATEAPAPAQAPVPETKTQEAAIQPEQAKPTEQPTQEMVQAELNKVYFDFDSSALSPEARDTLSKNAQYLAKNPAVKVRIEGNCDERGSDEYNMALGERRAKAARDYLVNLGVSADRLSIISYGLEKPVDPGHDEAAWSKNRRDEFVVIK